MGAPPPDHRAAGALPQIPKTATPLRISGNAPGYNSLEFLRFGAKKFLSFPPIKIIWIRHCLEALCKIYFALFHPHLLYGLVVWGSTFPTYLSKLESLQNKAVKIIGGGTTRESPTPFYGQLKILKLADLYKFEIAKLVNDFLHDKLPSSSVFSHLFQKSLQIFHRFTRSSSNKNKLHIPLYRTNRLQRSIRYQGVSVLNSIPMEIQNLPKHSFKVKLKEYLLQLHI